VIFNSSAVSQTFNYANNNQKASGYQLHPIQKNGADEVVKNSKVTATGFIVPPLTSAVFVKPR
jgi:phage-related protein